MSYVETYILFEMVKKMSNKSLQELEALRERLEADVRRSRLLQADGLTRNTPLIRNLDQVKRDIAEAKKNEGK